MKLLITGPEEQVRTVELAGPRLRLGRANDNEFAFPLDAMLSRYHLCFESQDSDWFVSDCGSRNGTVFNTSPLQATQTLHAGDRIFAGRLTIDVQGDQQAELVRFVPQDRGRGVGHADTIVTTLQEVLQGSLSGPEAVGSLHDGRRAIDALIRAGQELAVHRPLEELFTTILHLALEAVGSERGIILALEDGQLVARARRGDGFTISTGVRDEVINSKRSLVINDVSHDEAFRTKQSIVAQRVRSLIAVPLQTGIDVIGLLYLDNGTNLKIFSQDDLELLTVMANIAAIRIEHARLAVIAEQEKLTRAELEQAAEIQRELLPAETMQPENYALAAYNVPCRAVGGDYYDFLPYGDRRLAMLIADVCGKGMPAALMMSSLQARVQMLAASFPEPAQALTLLNRTLTPRFPPARFITAFYALLETESGALTYANAGHNYPIVVRTDGSIERLKEGGLVLAFLPETVYPTGVVQLSPGDTLCLFSDGVTETVNAQRQQFGEDRLARYLSHHRLDSPADIMKRLLATLREWSAGPFGDDLTLVLVRRLPVPAAA